MKSGLFSKKFSIFKITNRTISVIIIDDKPANITPFLKVEKREKQRLLLVLTLLVLSLL